MSTTLNTMGKTFARNTVQIRKDSSTNLTELAYITGVSRRTLGRIEAAKKARKTYNPMLKTAIKLAQAAGVTVDELLNEKLSFQ
jgi:DNA-binding XRE family transcriptional regulator